MDLWIHQIDLNALYENFCSVVLSSFFPLTVLLKVWGEWTPALCIPFGQCFHPTDSDPVYQVMTQKRSKGFFVKMFTAWSHLLNWPSFKRFFLLFLHWHMLILQEQYFHSSETFLKVRTRQWEWENELTETHRDFGFSSEFTTPAFPTVPNPVLQLRVFYEITDSTWVSSRFILGIA